jgi:hypothetical protein
VMGPGLRLRSEAHRARNDGAADLSWPCGARQGAAGPATLRSVVRPSASGRCTDPVFLTSTVSELNPLPM